MSGHFQHAFRFLGSDEKIAGCVAAIERHARLLDEVRTLLPSPLDAHCLHAQLEAGILTLFTDSPVWSSRLRFFSPEIERCLTPHYGSIVTCRIRVRPPAFVPPPQTAGNRLSARTVRHLLEVAAHIQDPRLAAALRRLAQTGAGDSDRPG